MNDQLLSTDSSSDEKCLAISILYAFLRDDTNESIRILMQSIIDAKKRYPESVYFKTIYDTVYQAYRHARGDEYIRSELRRYFKSLSV